MPAESLRDAIVRTGSPLDWEQMAGSDWTVAGDERVTPVSQSDHLRNAVERPFWPMPADHAFGRHQRLWQTLVRGRLISANRFNESENRFSACLRSFLRPFYKI